MQNSDCPSANLSIETNVCCCTHSFQVIYIVLNIILCHVMITKQNFQLHMAWSETCESQFLGRLIKSLGSPRRKEGSGASQRRERGLEFSRRRKGQIYFIYFFSTFLSFSHIKHFFNLSLELNHTTKNKKLSLNSVIRVQFIQSLNHVQLFATPWTAAWLASLSINNSWSLLKLMSIE